METKQKDKKQKGRKTAIFAGTVCSAVMLLGGGALMSGCGNDATTAKNGLSAYEIAVKYGYEGTEQQWLYDLQHQAAQGEQGPRGDDGRSAYDIAVDEGFQGTQADWIASMQGVGVTNVEAQADKWGIKTTFVFTLTNPTKPQGQQNTQITTSTTVVDPLRDYVADNTTEVALLQEYGVAANHIKTSTEGTYEAESTEDIVALVNAGVDTNNITVDTSATYTATTIEELAALNTVVSGTELTQANISTENQSFTATSIENLQLLDQYNVGASQVTIPQNAEIKADNTSAVLLALDYQATTDQVTVKTEEFYNVGSDVVESGEVADEVVTALISVGVEKIKLTDNIELSASFQIPEGTTIENNANLASKYAFTAAQSYATTITFDLGGKTLTKQGTSALSIKKDMFVTFQNGTINLNGAAGTVSTMDVQQGGKLVFDHITYTSTGTNVYAWGQSTLEVIDSTFNGRTYCIGTNAKSSDNWGPNIKLVRSTFDVEGDGVDTNAASGRDGDDTALFFNVPCVVSIDACTITGDRQGMIVRGGDVVVKDSTIKTTAQFANKTKYLEGDWKTGNEVPMAAITLGNRYTAASYDYNANLVLINTTVLSDNETVPTIYAWGKSAELGATLTLSVTAENFSFENFGLANASINQNVDIEIANANVATADQLKSVLALNAKTTNITLTGDLTLASNVFVTSKATIDLAGHTITEGTYKIVAHGENADATFTGNGVIQATSTALQLQQGAKATIENGTYTSTGFIGVSVSGSTLVVNNATINSQEQAFGVYDGANVTINGGVFTTKDNFVVGTNGTKNETQDRGHNTITINGGTFNGNIESAGYCACGIYVANDDVVVVNAGTFNITDGAGIVARAGKTTVAKDVVFNMITKNADLTTGKVGDSRVVVPTGKELVIDLLANYPGYNAETFEFNNNTTYEVHRIEKQ